MSATAVEQNVTDGIKVGDFWTSSWGYDQTNIDFYKVTKVTSKSIYLQRWTVKRVGSEGIHNMVVPGDSAYTRHTWDEQGKPVMLEVVPKIHRVRKGGYKGFSVSVASYANAYPWDGTPEAATDSYFGH